MDLLSWANSHDTHNMVDFWHDHVVKCPRTPPEAALWIATRPGVLPPRDLLLFSIRCLRSVAPLFSLSSSNTSLALLERYAKSNATPNEIRNAYRDAKIPPPLSSPADEVVRHAIAAVLSPSSSGDHAFDTAFLAATAMATDVSESTVLKFAEFPKERIFEAVWAGAMKIYSDEVFKLWTPDETAANFTMIPRISAPSTLKQAAKISRISSLRPALAA